MEKIKKALSYLDLATDEAEVYLAALELGTASVLEISRKISIPRATVYLVIHSLLKKNLLIQTAKGKKKRFHSVSPEHLIELAEDKQYVLLNSINILKQELPELQAIHNLRSEKPKIRYYQGAEGIKEIYEDTLTSDLILVHCATQHAIRYMDTYMEKYFIRVIRRMISTKEIVSDTKENKEYKKDYSTSHNEIICIPKKYSSNTGFMIWKNKIAYITYRSGEPDAIVIEDPEIVDLERKRFILIWNAAKSGNF